MGTPCERIVIAGFMGTGKSTSGRQAAAIMGWQHVDTDLVIERETRLTIRAVFDAYGEAAFRAMERTVLVDLLRRTQVVISAGGGMLISDINRTRALVSATVVCLDANPDVIEQRLSGSNLRPLASSWRVLYEARRASYALLPTHIDTSNRQPEDVGREIAALCQR